MIKRVRLINFKSLVDATVHLDKVTVLIGRSGSGKTNLIAAIRALRQLLREGLNVTLQPPWKQLVSVRPNPHKPVTFEFEFRVPEIRDNFLYRLAVPLEQPYQGVAEERLTLGDRVLFYQNQRAWVNRPEVVRSPAAGQIALPAISGSQEIAIACEVLSNGISCYDFPGTVLQNNSSTPVGVPLWEAGENFVSSLAGIENDLKHLSHWRQIIAAIQKLDPSVKSLGLARPNPASVEVVHQMAGQMFELQVSQESEGFRRFLAHLIALYQTSPRFLLAFEEPEKGIYPGALAVLAEEFKAAAELGRGQVLLTTHSPQLLDHFEPESVRVVEMDRDSTTIGPLAKDQFESVKEQLMTAGELLTVDPARTVTPAA